MEEENHLSYKTKNGEVLKGFSQTDLNKLQKWLKILTISFSSGVIFFMGIVIWLLWQIKRYKIITYFIQSLK